MPYNLVDAPKPERVIAIALSPAEVREWARSNAVTLSARGRIPVTVLEQYQVAAR